MNSIDHIGLYSITYAKPQTEKFSLGGEKTEKEKEIGFQSNTAQHKESKSKVDYCDGVVKYHISKNV